MIILSIDQSPDVSGFAFRQPDGTISCDFITAPHMRTLTKRGTSQAAWMAGEIVKLIEQVRPDVVVLEGVHLGRNVQTLITLAEFRGRLLQLCDMRSTPVITVTSPQLMAYLGLKPGTTRERKKQRSQFTATALIHGQVYATDGDNPLIDHNAADAVCLLMVAEARFNLARLVAESEGK